MVTGPVASDWTAIGNSLQPVLADWQANNMDAQLQPLYNQITPSMVNPSNFTADQIQQIVQSIQVFQPSYQTSDLQLSLNALANQPDSDIAGVLAVLQSSSGMAYYLNSLIVNAPKFAAYIAAGGAQSQTQAAKIKINPDSTCPACQPGNDGGGGWTCAKDGAAILLAGTAFAVLTVMSGGIIGVEGVLVATWWSGVAGWGSLATAGWGAGHVISGCSF